MEKIRMQKVPPPVIMFVGLFVEWLLDHYLPFVSFESSIFRLIGYVLIVVSLILAITSLRTFVVNKAELAPHRKPKQFVTSWPYSMTRNPMYLGLVLFLIGFAALQNSLSPFLVPVGFVLIINNVYIKMEEANMAAEFGKSYKDYSKKVRRWL